ncbi:thiaminase II [Flagellimonas crocea]|uniref:thiaminase II n=1 Tax=Flagellimonas crocea TaxID=3067311 RepID=UPI00296E60AC|nr:thiaminase II [Muricauda sp. DH64]
MKWTERTWKKIDENYRAILDMSFVQELAKGTLPRAKFQFYMAQDSLYLEHFGRALALIAAKSHQVGHSLAYIRFAEGAIVVENALHESYFEDFGITDKGAIQPACHHYTHFLKSTAALEPVEVAMAATLPCFWIYKKVGDHIYNGEHGDNNPYQRWIDTYGGDEFAESVQRAKDICDHAAEHTTPEMRERMTEAFIQASQLEYHFWEAAYDTRTWN